MSKEITCQLCGDVKHSTTTFMVHFNKNHHHEISIIDYCIKFEIHDRFKCKFCDEIARFHSITAGFAMTCSNQLCKNKYNREKTKEALLEKYGVENFWEIEGNLQKAKKTKLDKYGDENYNNPDKNKETNLERYGRISFVGTDEYNKKRTETCLERYGVEHHTQSPEFKEKMKDYFLETYGFEHSSQVPEVKQKIKETNERLYGGFTFASAELSKKARETMVELYGAEFAQQNEDIKKQTKQTNIDRYGVSFPAHCKERLFEKFGVIRVCDIPGLIELQKQNRQANLLEKYGIENISQLESTQITIRKNNLEKYGVESTSQLLEVKLKNKATCLDRYGFENPMQNPEIARKCFESMANSYNFKSYVTKFKDSVIYQSKPELEFIKECELRDIQILRGDIIQYLFNDELHYYFIDFKIFTDGNWQLVEIKGKHPWYYQDLESGKLEAKILAAEEYSKVKNFHPYKFILVD